MKALVTGATGFIGSHLAEQLSEKGHDVRLLARDPGRLDPAVERLGLEISIGDVRDIDSLKRAIEGRDTVFHAAALVGEWGRLQDFFDINVAGMRNMIDAAARKNVRRFIDISSTSVHGFEGFDHDTEELPYRKTGVLYGDTKMEAEKLVWEAHAQGMIEASTIRPCMVWGPRDRAFLSKIIFMLKKKRMIYIGGGNHNIGLTHVRNVCDALLLAAEKPEAAGKAFLITDDTETTLREVVETICGELGLKKPRFSISYPTAKLLSGVSETIGRRMNMKTAPMLTRMGVACIGNNFSFDVSRAKKILGYAPRYLFPQGLQEYLDWYKTEFNGKS